MQFGLFTEQKDFYQKWQFCSPGIRCYILKYMSLYKIDAVYSPDDFLQDVAEIMYAKILCGEQIRDMFAYGCGIAHRIMASCRQRQIKMYEFTENTSVENTSGKQNDDESDCDSDAIPSVEKFRLREKLYSTFSKAERAAYDLVFCGNYTPGYKVSELQRIAREVLTEKISLVLGIPVDTVKTIVNKTI
ncbi:MAG: hypothetical protein QW561_00615 [Candidatus Aenigmatarchaeota archaeon]